MGIQVFISIMTTTAWIFTLLVACSGVLAAEKSLSKKDPKQLSLFSIVTFPNLDCKSQDSGRNGTCFSSTECSDKGGKMSGKCASGFGVCCLFIYTTSGSTISQNCSYIQSPNFPSTFTSTDATSLTYTISKCSNDVCALRLDFLTFTTERSTAAAPAENLACGDPFTITTTSQGTSQQICGENAGQHIYYELGTDTSATATLAFTVSSATDVAASTRSFEIKVIQIPCTASYRPPSGCLQYLTGLTGTIKTFNYDATTAADQIHLATQKYSICIRPEAGMCCIQYSLCDLTAGAALNVPAWSLDEDGTAAGSDSGTQCLTDYVEIDGVSHTCDRSRNTRLSSRICGLYFSAGQSSVTATQAESVCDCSTPFAVGIVTDDMTAAGTANGGVTQSVRRGLCLDYQQIPC